MHCMKHNFCSGPAHLHPSIYQQIAEAVIDFNGSGLSILEYYHRTEEIEAVVAEAEALTKELLLLDDDHKVFFIAGGASMHFAMVPLNFLKQRAAYVQTGIWSDNAITEARKMGEVDVIASSSDGNYSYIPEWPVISGNYDYIHYTSNNTDTGTSFRSLPDTDIPLVTDMSSDIFSRKMDYNRLDLIYAGAQKNAGIAGCSLVIASKRLLERAKVNLPSILDYSIHANQHSMFNTPPVVAIYASLLNLRWLKAQGGVEVMEGLASQKAAMLYEEIERNPLFQSFAQENSRSHMNVTFTATNKQQEQAFLDYSAERAIVNIAGYRKIGGFRVSLYNAIEIADVAYLIQVMQEFERAGLR